MIRMNDIQQQIIQLSELIRKYDIKGEDKQLFINAIKLLIKALSMISKLGLEDELIKEME